MEESFALNEAFQTWKVLDELVDALLKPDSIDKKKIIQTLVNIVMYKEFSRMFIYTKEPGIKFEQYEDIVDKYRSFTVWLLGQFFYLLSCDDNEILVDAQLSIIDQLSRTQAHIYAPLAEEYCKALNIVCDYLRQDSRPVKIVVFESEMNQELSKKLNLKRSTIELSSKEMGLDLGTKILKIVNFVLVERITFYSADQSTKVALDDLLFLSDFDRCKCKIYQIFIDLIQRLNYNIDNWSYELISKFRSFFSLFEQFVYEFYNNNIPRNIDKDMFEDMLLGYLKACGKLKKNIGQNDTRISMFLINHTLTYKKTIPCKKIQIICSKHFCQSISDITNMAKNSVNIVINQNNSVMFSLLKPQIFKEICDYFRVNSHATSLDAYEQSETWKLFCDTWNLSLSELNCDKSCLFEEKLEFSINVCKTLLEVKIKFFRSHNSECALYFFNGNIIFPKILAHALKHSSCQLNLALLMEFMVQYLSVCDSKHFNLIFHLISCQLLVNSCYKSYNAMPTFSNLKVDINSLYNLIGTKKLNVVDNLKYLNKFFSILSSGLVKHFDIKQIETLHLNVLKKLKNSESPDVLGEIIESIPQLMCAFSNKDEVLNNIFLPLLSTKDVLVQQKIADIIQLILCTAFSDFDKLITANCIRILCKQCYKDSEYEDGDTDFIKITFLKSRADVSSITMAILKTILNFLTSSNKHVKQRAVHSMPSLTRHLNKFFTPDVTKIWIETAGDSKMVVRESLVKIIQRTIANGLSNPSISDDTKTKVLDVVFAVLLRLSKKSLQYSEFELQDTLLDTIDEIGRIEHNKTKLECLKIMLYFVMVPTSKQSLIAVSQCSGLSKKDASGHLSLYKHNTDVVCEVIVHLCYCNQHIINATLQESLIKVSVMLGFDGVKDFVSKEAKKLLPYLIAKIVKNENVHKLVENMAELMEVDISQLLTRNYGHIFLYLFLENVDRVESKRCFTYLESITKLSGPKLRNMNIKVILNELLSNFHEKRRPVLTAFQLLLAEDNTTHVKNVEDYIHPYFLPFLLYFDLELSSEYSKKDKMLLSLADLLKFLGAPRIMPLRFKIIAMLQTRHYLKVPELACVVWDAFIRSCDIDCLGPHLATIFTTMLTLIEACPSDVNRILRYLVIENENSLKDFIVDLFFVNDPLVSPNVLSIIKKYLKPTETLSLKGKIQLFLKYLNYDTVEVRIQSLKQLKGCLEQNREELDQMILGYNGIDEALVELIDYLTLGCREKDVALKLACGEVFGELGAIEPSHLPRRYSNESQTFIFFISEDAFIESALNELIKAFQIDKNARNTDRVALAIQEILKMYEICPVESSARNFMWKKFSDSHREVMTPFLSSNYICVENFTRYSCPIYGTSEGSSFQSWLNNWTSSLISTLSPEKRSLLQSCFPSMKLDKRVLMHFLPYILLHSLLEGINDNEKKACTEFQTILNSFNDKRTIDESILRNRPLPTPGLTPTPMEITAEEEKQTKCTKVVFILLDFLDRWLREWQWLKGSQASTDRNFQTIKRFLSKFCKLELAKCNYKCGEYPRALMYLENYITNNPDQMTANLQFLGEIYAQLDEPDGVLGVEPLQQSEPSLEQKLLSLEVSGKLNDAAAVYEHMPRPLKLQHIQGLIQCYLDLDKVNTALYCAEGALDLQPGFGNMLIDMQAEALWRLGTYEDLENLLDTQDSKGWGVQVGKSLLCIKKNQRDVFKDTLECLKRQQVDSFGAASLEVGAYHHGYSYITHLHRITELEQLEKVLFDLFLKPNDTNYAETIMAKLTNEWRLRLKVVQESVRVVEPLLCLRRVTLSLAKDIAEIKVPQAIPFIDKLLGETWLQSVNVARTAGIHQQAYTYVLDAEKFRPPKLFIEKAKLHWLREEHEEALITLKRGLNAYIPDCVSSQETQEAIAKLSLEQKKICAEAKLLIATYNNDICSVDEETNLQQYKEAVEVYKEWEKSLVCLAQYQDRIFQNYSSEEKDTKTKELQLHIVNNFGKSLYFGTNYIYQSMPRLLSIWFDYGTRLSDVSNNVAREERRLMLVKMTKIIDSFLNKLPPFVFLTSFSQIISRIAHPQKEVYFQLKSIIVKLMQFYPQQCLWMISSVIKSSYPIRAKRCSEILNDPRLRTQSMSRLIKDFTSLAEKLIELCNKEIPANVTHTTVNLLLRALPRMLGKNDFSQIMMPTHKFRKLILPNPDFKNAEQHNPFPNHYVHIVGISDDVSVLASLQRPRKIDLRGSDGKRYTFMLKPKDDLRKDFRLMEFNDIVNHLLMRDAEARQRRLNIRLYSVAPLNEECGLIEWVHDLVGFRPVLLNIYKQKGLEMRAREIKEVCCKITDSLAKKRDIFCNILLKRHPPVLGEWFRKTFPDAQTWLTARTGYIRTTAVISITGYMLGLGDRHGENILLDSTCGDVVHVDFNCLFNKGETFEWPERVPFRLTQNMIAAMGPLGVEGVFRKSCEFTLRVLRSNTATLKSIVTPFVYDPLVSWPRNVPAALESSEKVNELALEHIKNIELRLQGKVKTKSRTMSQCLSIEGQIDYLIKEAKSIDNLCQMYIGWGPYL